MGEGMNLWTEYSELRQAKRAELEANGLPEKEIRKAVNEIHPFAIKNALQQADEHGREEELAQQEDDIDSTFDRPDVLSPEWQNQNPGYKGD